MHRIAPALIAGALAGGPAAAADDPGPARQRALVHLLRHDCGACHGLTLKGGLGPPLRPADLEGRSPRALIRVILDGVPGTAMPPWRFELSRAEAAWLVGRLKQGLDDVR